MKRTRTASAIPRLRALDQMPPRASGTATMFSGMAGADRDGPVRGAPAAVQRSERPRSSGPADLARPVIVSAAAILCVVCFSGYFPSRQSVRVVIVRGRSQPM
jgi:hypothetical protein